MTTTTTQHHELVIAGFNVAHSCEDCSALRITPAAVETVAGSFVATASIEAGHGTDRGHVYIRTEDLPGIIAALQRIHDEGAHAAGIPDGWRVDD